MRPQNAHKSLKKSHKNPIKSNLWDFMGFYGVLWDFMGFLWGCSNVHSPSPLCVHVANKGDLRGVLWPRFKGLCQGRCYPEGELKNGTNRI